MNPFDKRPQSDGIRKKIVGFSSPAEKSEPQEEGLPADLPAKDLSKAGALAEEGIIITEPVSELSSASEPLLESAVEPEIETNDFLREEKNSPGDSQNTFFFESEPSPRIKNRPLWWGLGGGLVIVLIMAALLSTVFARITITLKPRVDTLTLPDTLVLMDASVSRPLSEQRVIPAERLEFNKKITGEFESTGREYIEEKARGKVRIYNRFSSSPQTLVEGTRFLTDSSALYRLAKSIVIPGAKIAEGKIIPEFVETELVADKAGEEGNLNGEKTLKIPGLKGTAKYEGFYAVAQLGFSGGFKGEARVVSKDDLKKAEEEITKKLYEELQQEMARKVPLDFKVMDSLREIQVTKLDSPRPNLRSDKFSAEVAARGRLIVFRESDSVAVLKETVLKDDKTREYIDGSASLEYQVKTVDFEKGRAEVVVRGNLKARAVVPEKELAEFIKNKKEGSLVEVLKNRNELASFSVAFFPPWLLKAPSDSLKIKFRISGD